MSIRRRPIRKLRFGLALVACLASSPLWTQGVQAQIDKRSAQVRLEAKIEPLIPHGRPQFAAMSYSCSTTGPRLEIDVPGTSFASGHRSSVFHWRTNTGSWQEVQSTFPGYASVLTLEGAPARELAGKLAQASSVEIRLAPLRSSVRYVRFENPAALASIDCQP